MTPAEYQQAYNEGREARRQSPDPARRESRCPYSGGLEEGALRAWFLGGWHDEDMEQGVRVLSH